MIYKVVMSILLFFSMCSNLWAELSSNAQGDTNHGFPRIMGMNIGKKHYDDPVYRRSIAKTDVLILGFYPGWGKYKGKNGERDAVIAIKKLNPDILIGQYSILNEAPASNNMKSASRDLGEKIDAENWWLKDENGNKAQWTKKYKNWDVNISSNVKKDSDGLRYPEWKARRDYRLFFKKIPEFNFWYLDNALSLPAVKEADWDLDGINDKRTNPKISREYRIANLVEWNEIKKLLPKIMLLANSDDVSSQEYKHKLNGVFMEALIGKSWSTERWRGWEAVMERYQKSMEYTLSPHLVGFNVWGPRDDYQRMRYGLTSCLLNNGYFSYTDEEKPYSSVPWFDEYDVDLGKPLEPQPVKPWKNGVYRRVFEKGIVLINPTFFTKDVDIEAGYKRFNGRQDPEHNDGKKLRKVRLNSKDGIILIKI